MHHGGLQLRRSTHHKIVRHQGKVIRKWHHKGIFWLFIDRLRLTCTKNAKSRGYWQMTSQRKSGRKNESYFQSYKSLTLKEANFSKRFFVIVTIEIQNHVQDSFRSRARFYFVKYWHLEQILLQSLQELLSLPKHA